MEKSKTKKPIAFRLSPSIIDLLESMSNNTGMSKTAIMEKAIIDYHKRYDNDLEIDIREEIKDIHRIVKIFEDKL